MLLAEVIPQVNKRQKIGFLIMKAPVFLIGSLLLIHWALARILNRECGSNDHRFAHTAMLLRFQNHTRQARVDRQLG
ncbi:Uncharacterised protein [Salmonella enterica subsp. enterica]|nr:Uncharacterised protein [Salmonella enterica subsp. enterica]